MRKKKRIGLYIHIPFCKSKCHYCDFNSYVGVDDLAESYVKSICVELIEYASKLSSVDIDTIFIGGGTPSHIDVRHIDTIVNTCYEHFNIVSYPEITIESNPGTLSYHKLLRYRDIGINRLSIGLQCAQDKILNYIGRTHTFEDFENGLNWALKAGFANINVDTIFGIPNQKFEDFAETLEVATSAGVTHISCYSLKIEHNTVFGKKYRAGEIEIDEDLDRDMYHFAINELGSKGFMHYEISNFAKPGFKSLHNLNCWHNKQYVGVGAGAHSYLNNLRYGNVCDLQEYIFAMKPGSKRMHENSYRITRQICMSEWVILRLRLVIGVKYGEFRSEFGQDLKKVFPEQIKKLLLYGLIFENNEGIKLTEKGLDLANIVFEEFV